MKSGGFRIELRLLRTVWGEARGHHLQIVVPMLLQMAVGVAPAAILWLFQGMAAGGGLEALLMDSDHVMLLLGLVVVTTVVGQLSTLVQSYAMANVKRNVERRFLSRLAGATYARVHDTMDNRNIMAITRESDMLTALIPLTYRAFIQAPVTIASFIVVMVLTSARMTLAVAALMVIVVVCCLTLRSAVKRVSRRLYDRYSDLHQMFAQWLEGFRIFKFYNATGFMTGKLESVVDDTCAMSKRLTMLRSVRSVVTELLTWAAVIVFVLMLDGDGGDGRTWVMAISFPVAILYIRDEAMKLSAGYSQLSQTDSAVRRLMEVYDLPTANECSDSGIELKRIESIGFRDVSYRYHSEAPYLLDHASMKLRPGGLTVLVGASGAGKTTCFDLLAGLRQPIEGEVVINDRPASEFSETERTARLAIVEQEPFIFEGTVRDNLTFGVNYEDSLLLELCQRMRLERIVSTTADLDRPLRGAGANLSVGEKQRLAFIRVLLKRPDVILLDEMTSNVDDVSSQTMIDVLAALAGERIVLCISHDPRVTSRAQTLIKLENGKLQTVSRTHG